MRNRTIAVMSLDLLFSPKQYLYEYNGTVVARWTVTVDDAFRNRWYYRNRVDSFHDALGLCDLFAHQNVKGQFSTKEWDAGPGVVKSKATVGILPGIIVKGPKPLW